eukprot:3411897-Amphidinium_carterae.1
MITRLLRQQSTCSPCAQPSMESLQSAPEKACVRARGSEPIPVLACNGDSACAVLTPCVDCAQQRDHVTCGDSIKLQA